MLNRKQIELYPDFTAETPAVRNSIGREGIPVQLLQKILMRHAPNRIYNKGLYDRYRVMDGAVPIFNRKSRFNEEDSINNRVNNDFFGEIVDFKTGYFAGMPISYSYSKTEESEAATGGKEAVEAAVKTITDFVTRNNMYGVDMEITKLASIYGYAGRLFYIDTDGEVRVMPVHGYETIVLSSGGISEPEFAIRYFRTKDINGTEVWTAELYDAENIYTYSGCLSGLKFCGSQPHLFDRCPLQAIANNREMIGDAEKVLALIDDYDKSISDNSNEIESFVHAYLVFENFSIDEHAIRAAQKSGTFVMPPMGTQSGKIYFLTKNINDAFTEHHLERLQNNIYRFSKTPNLNDSEFNNASGVSLKFKLHGLETKCGMFQAKMMDAAQYMWKLLASVWNKKGIHIDPLQATMDFSRNFPLDLQSEAITAQSLISAGLPKEIAFSQLSFIDDVDYVMQLIEEEQSAVPSFFSDGENEEAHSISGEKD